MKRFLALAGLAAGALTLGGCATDDTYGYHSAYWDHGPYTYETYYDGYYGQFNDGYWGDDGFFYYRGANDHVYHRGDNTHFRHDGNGDGGTTYTHMQGNLNRPEQGTRMPHFHGSMRVN